MEEEDDFLKVGGEIFGPPHDQRGSQQLHFLQAVVGMHPMGARAGREVIVGAAAGGDGRDIAGVAHAILIGRRRLAMPMDNRRHIQPVVEAETAALARVEGQTLTAIGPGQAEDAGRLSQDVDGAGAGGQHQGGRFGQGKAGGGQRGRGGSQKLAPGQIEGHGKSSNRTERPGKPAVGLRLCRGIGAAAGVAGIAGRWQAAAALPQKSGPCRAGRRQWGRQGAAAARNASGRQPPGSNPAVSAAPAPGSGRRNDPPQRLLQGPPPQARAPG